MEAHVLTTFFLLIFMVSVSATCSEKCNKRGVCLEDQCRCFQGYYSHIDEDANDACDTDLIREYGTGWIILQVYVAFGFFMVASMAALGFFFGRLSNQTKYATLFISARIVLASVMLSSSVLVLQWSVDPFGFRHTWPYIFSCILDHLPIPLAVGSVIAVLFHWVELYYVTMSSLKREEMMERVNSKYKSSVTVDSVLEKVVFLKKLRLPFLIAFIGEILLGITAGILQGLHIPFGYYLEAIASVYYSLVLVVAIIGFIFYGRKLMKLMPDYLVPKIRRVTVLIIAVAATAIISYAVYLILLVSLDPSSGLSFLVLRSVSQTFALGIAFTFVSIFVKPTSLTHCFYSLGLTNSNSNPSGLPTEDPDT